MYLGLFYTDIDLFPMYIYMHTSLSFVSTSLLCIYRVCVHVLLFYAHTLLDLNIPAKVSFVCIYVSFV